METTILILSTVCAVLLALIIFLVVKFFKELSSEEKAGFATACTNAVKVVMAALADGKITAQELVQIAKALIGIIAAFAGKSFESVAEELGATEYINTASESEEIPVVDNSKTN